MNVASEQEFKNAIATANKLGKPFKIDLINDISISSLCNITCPVSIDGGGFNIAFSKSGCIAWSGRTKGIFPCQTTPFGEIVKTDASLIPGDYIICQSNDKISVDPHNASGQQHPQEIHLVNYIKPKLIGVESFVVDKIDGFLSVLNPIENIQIKNFTASFDGTQPDYSTALKFDGVSNVVVENLHFKRGGPGAIWFNNAYNCRIDGCRIDGTIANDIVYGIVVGTANNFFINDCVISGCRHAFTTTAGTSKGVERWGTPLNVVVNNCIINVPTKDNGSTRIGLDSHPEGYGIHFKGCTVNIGGGNVNYGASARARATRFSQCIFNGGGLVKGIEIYSGDCSVDNCLFNNCWIGIATKKFRNTYSNNLSVTNCQFTNLTGPSVFLEYGTGHLVSNCVHTNVLTEPGSAFKAYKGPVIGNYRS